MKVSKRQLSVAVIASLVLLLVSAAVSFAAPATQAEPARSSLFMAVLVGLLYYCAQSPWFANLGFSVLYRPLIAGTLVGIAMGRPAEGIAIGANINVLYLGWISAGGSLPGDMALAGYLGTALALGGGLGVQGALAIAAPLGLLGAITWPLRMSVGSVIAHWVDAFAEKGDIKGVARGNYIYSQPFLFLLYAVPVALAAYLGTEAVAGSLKWITTNAAWILTGLNVASGMLAALGIALNLRFLFRGNIWPYFFIGFMAASLMGKSVNLLVLAVIGGALAYLHVLFTEGFEPSEPSAATEAAAKKAGAPGLLTKQDIFNSFVRWLCFSHSTYNWERMQGVGFAHSMTPIIEKLYKSKEDISSALKRHLVFYNTQPDFGSVINGTVIAMEEERAAGASISDEAINSVKTGLMGPMAGIGDTLQQGIVIPIALAISMGIATGGAVGTATQGNIIGPLFYLIVVAAFTWGIGWFLYWQGYVQGRAAVTNILASGMLNRVISAAGVLGNFIMGALAVSFVKVSTPVVIAIQGSKFEIQKIIDGMMPNLLPLVFVILVWWLLTKKKVSTTWMMVAIIIIGILGAIPIFPGADQAGKAIMVGLFG